VLLTSDKYLAIDGTLSETWSHNSFKGGCSDDDDYASFRKHKNAVHANTSRTDSGLYWKGAGRQASQYEPTNKEARSAQAAPNDNVPYDNVPWPTPDHVK
jgi:hypothetical protein